MIVVIFHFSDRDYKRKMKWWTFRVILWPLLIIWGAVIKIDYDLQAWGVIPPHKNFLAKGFYRTFGLTVNWPG
jgi:hypothetical protein